MKPWLRIRTGVAMFILGIIAAFVPQTWVERWLGLDPDGGSGLLEFCLVAVPLVLGFALAVSAAGRPLRSRNAWFPASTDRS